MGHPDDKMVLLDSSGHRISTGEVEGALASNPACSEAAVVGYDHDVSWQSHGLLLTSFYGLLRTPHIFNRSVFFMWCEHLQVKGQGIYAFVVLRHGVTPSPQLKKSLQESVKKQVCYSHPFNDF